MTLFHEPTQAKTFTLMTIDTDSLKVKKYFFPTKIVEYVDNLMLNSVTMVTAVLSMSMLVMSFLTDEVITHSDHRHSLHSITDA